VPDPSADTGTDRGTDNDGYVHEPDGEPDSDTGDREFDRRGWALVAVLVFAFAVAPAAILLRPPAVPFEVAFLVLPLIPAFLLGAVAVWATTRG